MACTITGAMLHVEIQRGKEGMTHSEHTQTLGAISSCMLCLANAAKHCGQNPTAATGNDFYYGDSWFASQKAAEALYEMVSFAFGSTEMKCIIVDR